MKAIVSIFLSFAVLITPALGADSGPDDLWEVTVKMEMPRMPMGLGRSHTVQRCVEKGGQEKAVPMEKNCRMLDFQRSGHKTSYRFECNGDTDMTGSGEVTYAADGHSYQGRMQLNGATEGEPVDIKQSFTGKRIGHCSAGDEKKKAAAMRDQQNQSIAQSCTPPPDSYELQWQMYEKNRPCAEYRGQMCKRAREIPEELSSDPAKYARMMPQREKWREGLERCGVDPDKVAPPCKQAVARKNWDFVVDYCETETKSIGAKQCAGRDYTSAMAGEYAPICRAYAKGNVQRPPPNPGGKSRSSAKDVVTEITGEKLKSGLKGVFGF